MQHAEGEKTAIERSIALIVAGGRGERAGGDVPKQYRALLSANSLALCARAFFDAGIGQIVVVASKDHEALAMRSLVQFPGVTFVPGGETRTASVRAGLASAAPFAAETILIHDAARPGLTPTTIHELLDALGEVDGVAPALPVSDALRRAGDAGIVSDLIGRAGLYRVQTPQAFRFEKIVAAYAQAGDTQHEDDLAVGHAAGLKLRLIPGDARLMKLTYPEDFAILETLMRGQTRLCVGSGFDAHRFGEGDHVTLCGVKIAHDRGLIGHSDADAGWHALVDALLGAIGAGDIGAHFPPTDQRWKGANSETFLRHACDLVVQAGGRIQNVDVTLICERPKIGPHRDAMRARTAEVLGLDSAFVNIKATTTEKMGFTGRQEGLAAEAVVSVERRL